MRILLVQPATKYPNLKPLRSKTRWLVGITLPYLAGVTPKGIQVDLADDRLAPIPYHMDYDLVGITATSLAFFNVATPRRGTPMWDQLQAEGRVHNPEAEKYLGMVCNFFPKHMTPRRMRPGSGTAFKNFTRFPPSSTGCSCLRPAISFRDCPATSFSIGRRGARSTRWIIIRLVMQGREGRTQALDDELHRQGGHDQAHDSGNQADAGFF
jgi:hypothetical protein